MLRANTGSSQNPDARAAGREAAAKAAEGLDRVKVVLVHASGNYYEALPQLVMGIGDILPGAPTIGGTSWQGVILPEGVVHGKYFVGLLALADDDLTVGVASAAAMGLASAEGRDKADKAVQTGREAALAAMKKAGRTDPPDYFYISSMPGFDEFYLQGIIEIIGHRPMFGNSAADTQVTGDWTIFTDEGVVGYGLAVAFFYTPKPLNNHFTSEPYAPPEGRRVRQVTQMVTPRRLMAVEGELAIDRLIKNTGFDPDLLTAADLQLGTVLNPIGVQDQPDGRFSLRFPMYLRPDGGMDLAANLTDGAMVIHMQAEVDDLVAAGGRELEVLSQRMTSPAGAYYLSMGFGRGLVIHDEDRLEELAALVRRAAGGVPFLMTFSLTEYGSPAEGQNCCANLMLSYTGFSR